MSNPASLRHDPVHQSKAAKAKGATPKQQAVALQRLCVKDIEAKATPVHVRAALLRAWVDIQEMRLVLEGKGKPKTVTARNDPDAKARNKSKLGLLPEPIALAPATEPKAG